MGEEASGHSMREFTILLDEQQDMDLLDYLETQEHPEEVLRSLVNLGRTVQLAATFSTSQEVLSGLFSTLDNRIDRLVDTMEEFQGKTKNASVIGAMGEDIAANQFRTRFHATGDSFEVISNEGHEMDITGSMNISSDLGPHLEEVRLEIKQYTKAVPSGEVQKFWDDLQEGAASYGMMVSMKTPITGKPHFSLESRGGKLALFIANEDHQQERHLVAWELLRHIVKSDLVARHVGSGVSHQVQTLLEQLGQELELLNSAQTNLGAITRTGQAVLNDASKHAGELYATHAKVAQAIEQFKRRMKHLIQGTSEAYREAANKALDWNESTLVDIMELMGEKNKPLVSALQVDIKQLESCTTMNIGDSAVSFHSTSNDEVVLKILPMATALKVEIHADLSSLEFSELWEAKEKKGVTTVQLSSTAKNSGTLPLSDLRKVVQLLTSGSHSDATKD